MFEVWNRWFECAGTKIEPGRHFNERDVIRF